MARETHQREDLLRDATALLPRVMLRVTFDGEPLDVFAGFRGDSLSVYFGADPVLHFNAAGQLRRAFVDGKLIKAERGRLVSLQRRRSAEAVMLERSDLDDAADWSLLNAASHRLDQLRQAVNLRAFALVGEVPAGGDAVGRLERWLADRSAIGVADGPRVD